MTPLTTLRMANIPPLDRPVANHCGTDFLIFFFIFDPFDKCSHSFDSPIAEKKEKHALAFVSVLKSTMRAKIVID